MWGEGEGKRGSNGDDCERELKVLSSLNGFLSQVVMVEKGQFRGLLVQLPTGKLIQIPGEIEAESRRHGFDDQSAEHEKTCKIFHDYRTLSHLFFLKLEEGS